MIKMLWAATAAVATLAACAPAHVNPQDVTLNNLQAGATISSPLVITGDAAAGWYFEAQFPVRLVAADGAVLAEAPARAQGDWMSMTRPTFRAELTFTAPPGTRATLTFEQDMPGEGHEPRTFAVPVVVR